MPRKKAPAAPEVRVPKRATPADKIPRVVAAPALDDHLRIITRAVFQAGMSWAFIEARWSAFEAAFDGFATAKVAAYGPTDIDRIMAAEGVIHSRSKIEGTIRNAQALLALATEPGGVDGYAARFTSWNAVRADVKRRFAYVGNLSTYYWLFRTGQAVPRFEDWMTTEERDHPRMREMVTLARADGVAPPERIPLEDP